MTAAGKRARKTRRTRKQRPNGPAPAGPGLNEAGRALLGDDPKRRAREPRPDEEGSIEDPLHDWPESR
jgi:hypothetical protein